MRTLYKDTGVIVQIPFIKVGFIKRFNFDSNKVHMAFPYVENIDLSNITSHDFVMNVTTLFTRQVLPLTKDI